MFDSADGFPDQSEKALHLLEIPALQDTVSSEFSGIPSGTYGISVLHDENRNRKMDKNWLGLPKEGYGASNNARARFGPPSFKAARFLHTTISTTTISLQVKY
ncbi:MAG: DUF2141 domain-containing protein [Candidatus Ozemobacteraceae bacterium]